MRVSRQGDYTVKDDEFAFEGAVCLDGTATPSRASVVVLEHHPSSQAAVWLRSVSGRQVTTQYEVLATQVWREHLTEYPLTRIFFVDIIEQSRHGKPVAPSVTRARCTGWVERRGWLGRRTQLEDPTVVPRTDEVRAITEVSWGSYHLPPELDFDPRHPPNTRGWKALE